MKSRLYKSSINSFFSDTYIINQIINTNNTIDTFYKLIYDDDITFDEYVLNIKKIYDITITDNDLIRIASFIFGKNTKIAIINTDILCDVIDRIEIDNCFEYIAKKDNLYIKIAFNDNDILLDHIYTYTEILNLINTNKIILLELIPFNENYSDDIYEYNNLFPLKNITDGKLNEYKYINEIYLPYIYAYLKNFFSKDKLKSDLALYLKDLKIKLTILENFIRSSKIGYNNKLNTYEEINILIKKLKNK